MHFSALLPIVVAFTRHFCPLFAAVSQFFGLMVFFVDHSCPFCPHLAPLPTFGYFSAASAGFGHFWTFVCTFCRSLTAFGHFCWLLVAFLLLLAAFGHCC